MNKLIKELEKRIKLNIDLGNKDREFSGFYADKVNLLKEYLDFVNKVEDDIARNKVWENGRFVLPAEELKQRIFGVEEE